MAENEKKSTDKNIEMIRFAMQQVYGPDAADAAMDYLDAQLQVARKARAKIEKLEQRDQERKKKVKAAREKVRQSRKMMDKMGQACGALAKGEMSLDDGTRLEIGGTYYGGDGRAWKLLFARSDKWLEVEGFDLDGNPVELQVKREWLTVEPPVSTDDPSYDISPEVDGE